MVQKLSCWSLSICTDQFFNLGSSFYHVRCAARVGTRPYSLFEQVPAKSVIVRKRPQSPWFDGKCRNMKRTTRRLEQLYRAARSNASYSAWRTQFDKQHPRLQSAYRPHHSTETAILKVLSDILLAIDAGNLSALVLLDLSAAFDTVDHSILLRRLEHQLGSVALEWFKTRSYLGISNSWSPSTCADQLFILGSSFYHVRCAAGVGTRPYSLFAVNCRSAVID